MGIAERAVVVIGAVVCECGVCYGRCCCCDAFDLIGRQSWFFYYHCFSHYPKHSARNSNIPNLLIKLRVGQPGKKAMCAYFFRSSFKTHAIN